MGGHALSPSLPLSLSLSLIAVFGCISRICERESACVSAVLLGHLKRQSLPPLRPYVCASVCMCVSVLREEGV